MAFGIRKQGQNSNDINMMILTPTVWLFGVLPTFDGSKVTEDFVFHQFPVLNTFGVSIFPIIGFMEIFVYMLTQGPSPCHFCKWQGKKLRKNWLNCCFCRFFSFFIIVSFAIIDSYIIILHRSAVVWTEPWKFINPGKLVMVEGNSKFRTLFFVQI